MTEKLKLVCATRAPSAAEFNDRTLLGRSLRLFPDALHPELVVRFGNTGDSCLGLSAFYNQVIASTPPDVALLFVHDDVFIHDVFLRERLIEAFARFDVVGLAGSRSADLTQPSWALSFDDALTPLGWQGSGTKFSGAVSHHLGWNAEIHENPTPHLSHYGPTPDFVTLLDGLFLAVKTSRLETLRFDERFAFHCYDIDFCRQATDAGLLLGTWPILCTHASGGAYGSDAFKTAARQYRKKWGVKEFERELRRPSPASPPPAA